MKATRESTLEKQGTWLVRMTGLSLLLSSLALSLLLSLLVTACGGSKGSGAEADMTPQAQPTESPAEPAGATSMPAAPPAAAPEPSMATPATPPPRPPGTDTAAGPCPMQVPGTTVQSVDMEGGAALVFRTGGDVDALRERVRAVAAMHNRMHSMGTGMGGGPGHHGRHGHRAGAAQPRHPMVSSSAFVQDVEGGAILLLKPRDPAQLDALRAHVAQMAERMSQGQCMGMEGWILPGPDQPGTMPGSLDEEEPEAAPEGDEQEG